MAKHEFNNLPTTQLHAMLAQQREKLVQMRFDLADKKLKRTSDLGATKKTIARIMTALKQSHK